MVYVSSYPPDQLISLMKHHVLISRILWSLLDEVYA